MLPKHTKKQLIHLAPKEMLFQHVKKLNIPDYIYQELWEQKNFFSAARMEKMNSWNYEQFVNWYDGGL